MFDSLLAGGGVSAPVVIRTSHAEFRRLARRKVAPGEFNRPLMRAVAAELRALEVKQQGVLDDFNMATWLEPADDYGCGSAGCLAGWTVALTAKSVGEKFFQYWRTEGDLATRAARVLGLDEHQADALFMEPEQGYGLVKATDAAAMLEWLADCLAPSEVSGDVIATRWHEQVRVSR